MADKTQASPETMQQVETILRSAPGDDKIRHKAWDAFFSSENPQSFRKSFDSLDIPREVKRDLWGLKFPQSRTSVSPGATPAPPAPPESPDGTPWYQRPIVPLQKLIAPPSKDQGTGEQFTRGGARGVAGGVGALSSVENLGLMGSMGLASKIPVIGPYIAAGAGVYFTYEMMKGLVQSIPEAWDAAMKGDAGKLGEIIGQDLATAFFAKQGASKTAAELSALGNKLASSTSAARPAPRTGVNSTISQPGQAPSYAATPKTPPPPAPPVPSAVGAPRGPAGLLPAETPPGTPYRGDPTIFDRKPGEPMPLSPEVEKAFPFATSKPRGEQPKPKPKKPAEAPNIRAGSPAKTDAENLAAARQIEVPELRKLVETMQTDLDRIKGSMSPQDHQAQQSRIDQYRQILVEREGPSRVAGLRSTLSAEPQPAPAPVAPVASVPPTGAPPQKAAEPPAGKGPKVKAQTPKAPPTPAAAEGPQLSQPLQEFHDKFNSAQRARMAQLPFHVRQALLAYMKSGRESGGAVDPTMDAVYRQAAQEAKLDPQGLISEIAGMKGAANAPKPVPVPAPKTPSPKPEAEPTPESIGKKLVGGVRQEAMRKAGKPEPQPKPGTVIDTLPVAAAAPAKATAKKAKVMEMPKKEAATPEGPAPPAVDRTKATKPIEMNPPAQAEAPTAPYKEGELPPFIIREFDEIMAKKRAGETASQIDSLKSQWMRKITARGGKAAQVWRDLESSWEQRRGEQTRAAESDLAQRRQPGQPEAGNPVLKPEDIDKVTTTGWRDLSREVQHAANSLAADHTNPAKQKAFADAVAAAGLDPNEVARLQVEHRNAVSTREQAAAGDQPRYVREPNLKDGELRQYYLNRVIDFYRGLRKGDNPPEKVIIQTRGGKGKASKKLAIDPGQETGESLAQKIAKLDKDPGLVVAEWQETGKAQTTRHIMDLGRNVREAVKDQLASQKDQYGDATPDPKAAPPQKAGATPAPPKQEAAPAAPAEPAKPMEPVIEKGDPAKPLEMGKEYVLTQDLDAEGPFAGTRFIIEAREARGKKIHVRVFDEDTGKFSERQAFTDVTEDQLRKALQGESPAKEEALAHISTGARDPKLPRAISSFEKKNPNASLQEMADHLAKKFPAYSTEAFLEYLQGRANLIESAAKLNEKLGGKTAPVE